jgi:hypothetical protein
MGARDAPAGMADDTDSDLRARVAELEATVEAQQETIRKMLPGRRGVLKAGGLLAGGGVLGALSADRASADVVGQVGTSQDRVDVFAGAVDANSVSTVDFTAENAIVSQDTIENLTEQTGDRVDLASGAFETIFNVAGVLDVLGGVIYGPNPRNLEVTWDDDTTDEIWGATSVRGQDDADNEAMATPIPPIKDASSLVFQNGSGTTETYGYRVTTI